MCEFYASRVNEESPSESAVDKRALFSPTFMDIPTHKTSQLDRPALKGSDQTVQASGLFERLRGGLFVGCVVP